MPSRSRSQTPLPLSGLPTVAELKAAVQKAVKDFGTYSFMDKGAHEVMDLSPILARLRTAGGAATGALLASLLNERDPKGLYERLVGDLVSSLDDWSDAAFAAMLAADARLADLY